MIGKTNKQINKNFSPFFYLLYFLYKIVKMCLGFFFFLFVFWSWIPGPYHNKTKFLVKIYQGMKKTGVCTQVKKTHGGSKAKARSQKAFAGGLVAGCWKPECVCGERSVFFTLTQRQGKDLHNPALVFLATEHFHLIYFNQPYPLNSSEVVKNWYPFKNIKL